MPAQPNGKLIQLSDGKAFPLLSERLILGRRESCDIRLPYPNVSSVHFTLTFREGHWHVEDLNSTNGVKVNGARVHQQRLMPGDEIAIATRRFRIEYDPPDGSRRGTNQGSPSHWASAPSAELAKLLDMER